MKNKAGFIPKSLMQPQYYKKFFDLYAAVYLGSNQKEYMLQNQQPLCSAVGYMISSTSFLV